MKNPLHCYIWTFSALCHPRQISKSSHLLWAERKAGAHLIKEQEGVCEALEQAGLQNGRTEARIKGHRAAFIPERDGVRTDAS